MATEAAFARKHGIARICLEMHPGFCVYNPETLLRLRRAVGPAIGANFDPSHLFWQGIDPVLAIRKLAGAIFHVHAKDCRVDAANVAVNGVLDAKHYGDAANRAWVFRTVGFGHNESVWRDILSALRVAGYDGAISIEHEDGMLSSREGLTRAVQFLRRMLIEDKPGAMTWA